MQWFRYKLSKYDEWTKFHLWDGIKLAGPKHYNDRTLGDMQTVCQVATHGVNIVHGKVEVKEFEGYPPDGFDSCGHCRKYLEKKK